MSRTRQEDVDRAARRVREAMRVPVAGPLGFTPSQRRRLIQALTGSASPRTGPEGYQIPMQDLSTHRTEGGGAGGSGVGVNVYIDRT